MGEAAGELVRLYEELNRRAGTAGAPDPLHHHEISEDELVELGLDREALNAIYGLPRTTQEPVVEGDPVPFTSQAQAGSEMARDWSEVGSSGGGSGVQ